MKDELEQYWNKYLSQLRCDLHQRVGVFAEDAELRELLLESLRDEERAPPSVLKEWSDASEWAQGMPDDYESDD